MEQNKGLLMPVDKAWEKLATQVMDKLGLTWEDWVWLVDKLKSIIEKQERERMIAELENHRGIPTQKRHPDSRVYFTFEQVEWQAFKK